MFKDANAITASAEAKDQNRMTELKVSGHLMSLDTGLFCLLQSSVPDRGTTGLPAVRLSLPPNTNGRPNAVTINTLRPDGWLGSHDAALVRVAGGPAQVLLTIYQSSGQPAQPAPKLQVLQLSPDGQQPARVPQPTRKVSAEARTAAYSAGHFPEQADLVAHIQRTGDVAAKFGSWVGTPGSRCWIEGFGIVPKSGISASEIEYQAVLGRDWLSPWVESGKFCGSRGMALPLLGLRLRLKGAAAEQYQCSYRASFVDGTRVGPVPAGETCLAESLAALEAFEVVLTPQSVVQNEIPASQTPVAVRAPRAPAKTAKPSRPGVRAAVAKRR
jgi:hypothetical protein